MIKFVVFLGLVACLWAIILYRAHQHELKAEAEFPPMGQLLEIEGHQVHALVMGEGPDLVLLHGSGGNLRDLTLSLAPDLAKSYRVILLDRPGHGYTDRLGQNTSLQDQARLLSLAARQLGAEKPIVMGHSFGGAVALAWAVYLPDHLSALVPLAAPSHPWTTGVSAYYKLTANPVTAPVINPVLSAFVPDERVETAIARVFAPDPLPDGYLDHFGAALTLRRDSLRANALQRVSLLPQIKAMVPLYANITVPTEIVHGTSDDTVGLSIHSDLLVDDIPNAALTRLQGIGHMPQHAASDAVINAIHRVAERAGLR